MNFSIVIPSHNEADSLKVLIPRILKVLIKQKKHKPFELILIDDASTDNTQAVIKKFASKHPSIKPIYLKKRSGQTGGFKAGFKKASGRYLIRMDADLQDLPEDLPLFFDGFQKGADLIMGLRECRKHKRVYRLASYVFDFLVVLIFNSPLHANSGSFVGFKTKLVENINFKKNDHRYLPLIAIHRGAKNIKEVIVRHGHRQFGVSKYHPLKKLFFGFFEVWRFFFRLQLGHYHVH